MKLKSFRPVLAWTALGTAALVTLRVLAADGSTNSAACGGSCCSLPTSAVLDTNLTLNASATVTPDLLPTCPVSGDKLGEMGDAYRFVYQGQEVKLCCSGCKKDFLKDPAKYLALIRAADKK
jgi:YHS domain-containing protein